MIRIQKRDAFLLIMMARYGVLNNKTINEIYGNSKRYYRYRKKDLADEKYIIKTNTFAYLGAEGKRYLESIGINEFKLVKSEKGAKERLGKIAEILIPLQEYYDCYPSFELKRKGELGNRKLLYYGKIVNRGTGSSYYIYNAGSIRTKKFPEKGKNKKEKYIDIIKNEILQNSKLNIKQGKKEIVQNAPIEDMDKVIILIEDKLTMEIYKGKLESLGVEEQLLIPFNKQGIELLKQMSQRDIKKEAIEFIYGKEYREPNWKYADYTVEGDKQAIVLINNDGEKIVKIKQNLAINQFNYTRGNEIIVICLEGQKKAFQKEFNEEITIKTIKDEVIFGKRN